MNRTAAIILTVASALVCGCLALFSCVFGGFAVTGTPLSTELNGVPGTTTMPTSFGVALLCLSVILVLIPVVIGFLTLRNKPAQPAASTPIPPAS